MKATENFSSKSLRRKLFLGRWCGNHHNNKNLAAWQKAPGYSADIKASSKTEERDKMKATNMSYVALLEEDDRATLKTALRAKDVSGVDLDNAMNSRSCDLLDVLDIDMVLGSEVGEWFRVEMRGEEKVVVVEGYMYTVGEGSADSADETWRKVDYDLLVAPLAEVAARGICEYIADEAPLVEQYITDLTATQALLVASQRNSNAVAIAADEVAESLASGCYVLQ
ncbi:MAG: hypothetical protein RR505_12570 [Raoultibacter sp.]